jgi:type I restriction enzyme M protein
MINPQLGEKILRSFLRNGWLLTTAIEHFKTNEANSIEEPKHCQKKTHHWLEYKPLPYLLATTNLILHDA